MNLTGYMLKKHTVMVRKLVIMMCVLLCPALYSAAQNSIDNMLDHISMVGEGKFTSVVERNPKTRRVKKVVRVLEMHDKGVRSFINAFKREAGTGDFSEKRVGDGLTMVLAVSKGRQNRVYMLKCTGRYGRTRADDLYSSATVTVIVKYD